jgi:hypothetical protein
MFKVLMVDDNKGYVQSQLELASNMEIDLDFFDNWEEAQKILEENPGYYKAVILDGKGKLKKDGKEENVQHLYKATTWLREQKAIGNCYHYVINTGFSEEINSLIIDEEVYGKFGEEEKMFTNLLGVIKKLDLTKVEEKYPDVISTFNDIYLPLRAKEIITNLLISHECKKPFNKPFNSIRDLLEIICKRANQIDPQLFPNELIDRTKNNKPNLKAAAIYFSGRKLDLSKIGGAGELTCSSSIFINEANWAFSSLVEICHILSHDEENKKPHKYAFENALFGICEVIICFRSYMDINYPGLK